ncbi:MAG TPA: transketolase [Pseudonocardiaceae bacterium]|nr:transketolase [Pseudonocardiaceae bacterium]
MRDTFARTVDAALDEDPRLAVVLADISYAALEPAARRHPDRVINLGIREQLLISVTSGLALAGLRPIAHTFPSFLVERPFEQIKLDLGHQDVGAVLVSAGGSYDMTRGGRTHQSPGDVALLDTLPGWTIHVPGDPGEAQLLLRNAMAGDDRVYLRLSAQANAQSHVDSRRPGLLRVIRQGRRGVVLAVGPMLDRVLAATEGLDVTVAYTATVRPLDGVGLRTAVLAADKADVVLVEPYLTGTSTYLVDAALEDLPHRVRSLGVSREAEVRMYGEMADHDAAHGLDERSLAGSIAGFLG